MAKIGHITLSTTPIRPIEPIEDDYFYRSLCAMIDVSSHIQGLNSPIRKHVSASTWLDEYCTIKLYGPRQCGKTSSIIRYILKNRVSAYVFTDGSSTSGRLRDIFRQSIESSCNLGNYTQRNVRFHLEDFFINVDCIERVIGKYCGSDLAKFIFIDNYSYLNPRKIEDIRGIKSFAEGMITNGQEFHFVMVG